MSDERYQYVIMLKDILLGEVQLNVLKNETESQNRAFFNMLILTTLRQLTFIKEEILPQFLKKKIPTKQKILEYLLYLGITELLFLKTPDYAVINSYVEIAKNKTDKFGANFVNAILRNVNRKKDALLKNRKSKFFSKNFLQILKKDYSIDEINDMEEFVNIEPSLDISVKKGYSFCHDEAILLPTGSFRLPSNSKVYELPDYQSGQWWVQDASSALAVRMLSSFNVHNKDILDLCAAPGGKTAQLLAEGASVTAVDISEKRLKILEENIRRLRLEKNLTTICADARLYKTDKKYDAILVDAPCSATGTFRRHPEIIHSKTYDDVKKMASLQKDILDNAVLYLKDNGILIYATCSLSKLEGEQQVYKFLTRHQEFEILPICLNNCENMRTKDGFLRILPQNLKDFSGVDGFFIAYLKRKI